MLNKFLITLMLTLSLSGCLWDTKKPEAPVAVTDHYIPCPIPDRYFIPQTYPTRQPGFWTSGKKESDMIDFITEHRSAIDQLNTQISNIQAVVNNCAQQAQGTK